MQQLINKLPFDVILNNILPYTYQTQPKKLLYDIRSYVADYKFIDSIYMTQYNEYILLHDLLKFCFKDITPPYGIKHHFETILRRHFCISNKNDEQLINLVRLNFHRNMETNTDRKMRFLWGLLTPVERTKFINKFIIMDDDF